MLVEITFGFIIFNQISTVVITVFTCGIKIVFVMYEMCGVNLHIYRAILSDCWGTIVQGQFRTKLGKQPPSDNSIRRWYARFQETGCACIPERKVCIRTAIETITADTPQTVWNELDYCVDICRITKGAHIEHL